ncbi:hypothetical protein RN001_009479 [Aquatica leii]|uniref:Kinesin-like protein n=1 Tax=Aquatica leii TaxID=1421715 RepID=A0AAN7SMY3_9COLE|nr:hypothetical protein RN001_009479 [Aquatica leii]
MVKSKRDLKSPKRKRSLTGSHPITRTVLSNTQSRGNINVVVRVRPLHEKENTSNNRNVIKISNEHTVVFDPKEEDDPFFYHGVQQKNRDIMKRANKNLSFSFDYVFNEDSSNEMVFEGSTKSLIDTLMKGYNCSVFVYGATGAGKTHTMLGSQDDPGITFLTLMELFKQKEALQNEREFEIGMTYLEVYNETVQDLLNPGTPLSLREDAKYGVIVAGIKMHRIEDSNILFDLLAQGNRNRTQHPTDANTESSRSHAVFQVYLRMKVKASNEISTSKLSMIDLAGSERGAATGFSGARFTEGANINKSLLALGNCINSLADGRKHIPYRDSKLTRLLKDSLGGNCQTVMIANISPSALNYEDTYNTLKYAMRAKKIKASVKKNIVVSESNLNHYVQLVEQLKKENEELKFQIASNTKECNSKSSIAEPTVVDRFDPVPTNLNDLQLHTNLQKLYDDNKQLEQRISQLESAKQLAALRKELKQETQSRISGVCANSAEKNQCRSRLGKAVDRLDRQTKTMQDEITQLKERSNIIDNQIQEILDKNPLLKEKSDAENAKLLSAKLNNKVNHFQKVCDLQTGELRIRSGIIQCFSEVVQSCFLQLRGHGLATEALTAKYNGLMRNLQGIRKVSWDDDSETCISSTTSSLNNTFVIAEVTASGCNDNMETKVFTKSETPSKTQTEVLNVCAEDMMFRVNNPSTPDMRIPPLGINTQLQTLSKTVTVKRLLPNVYQLPSPKFAKSSKINQNQKENQKPHVRHHSAQRSDSKPSSARSKSTMTPTNKPLHKSRFK